MGRIADNSWVNNNWVKPECKHIYGYDCEVGLVNEEGYRYYTPHDTIYKYCPLCGIELKPEVGDE